MNIDRGDSMAHLIEAIETDFPGWDWLLRSNNRTDESDASTEKYFANLMTPDFVGHVVLMDGVYYDISPGQRFMAYGQTREAVLFEVYQQAVDSVLGGVVGTAVN